MPDQPDLPALSDDLTAVADKQIKVVTEARIASKAPALVWSGCIGCGPGADGDAFPVLGQQRVHMRCPRGILDHDNHGCRCVRVLSAVSS